MHLLMISTDRKIFEDESAVRQRMVEYGSMVDELHIVVFTTRRFQVSGSRFQIADNVWVYPTNSRSRWLYIFDAIRIGTNILNTKYQTPDTSWLVTAQDPFETGLAGWRIARAFNLPLQIQIHTDFLSPYFKKHSFLNRFRVWIARFLLPKTDCVRVVSKRIGESLINQLPITNYQLLPVWIDAESIRMAKPAEKPFDFTILWVGRLEAEKDPVLALKTFAQWMSSGQKDAGLVFVGYGSLRERLEKEAVELDMGRNVQFVGWQEDIAPWYKTADALLVTSHYEGYGRHIAEARIAGLPVVSPDIGIAPEAGAIVVRREAESLASALGDVQNGSKVYEPFSYHYADKDDYLTALRRAWESCGNDATYKKSIKL